MIRNNQHGLVTHTYSARINNGAEVKQSAQRLGQVRARVHQSHNTDTHTLLQLVRVVVCV